MLAEVAAITGVPYVFFPSLRKNLPCEILAFGVLRSAVYYMYVYQQQQMHVYSHV